MQAHVPDNKLSTILQHSGDQYRVGQGLVGATEVSVTFRTRNIEDHPVYARLGNTANHQELEHMLAALHGAQEAIATGSGMSVWTLIAMSLLKPGDHVLCLAPCYGGTYHFFHSTMKRWDVEVSFAPLSDWESVLQTKPTKMAIVESISNPLCTPQDLRIAAALCKRFNVLGIVDNTFASPILCQPLSLGFDLVTESVTKYINGHSDVIAGAVTGNADIIASLRPSHAYLGTFLATTQCSFVLRGLRTLQLRMKAHTANALRVAELLRRTPDLVARVHYGSTDAVVTSVFPLGFGGMMAVEFQPRVDVLRLMKSLKLIRDVPSLGGTESTATMPTFTTNWFMSQAQKATFGVTDKLVRLSVGLEDPDEIARDLLESASENIL